MDRISESHRSWNMSRISGKNTKPELQVRKFLYAEGIRYRIHMKLPGKPDIALTKSKKVIFVNGCFWHGHQNCKDFRLPKTRTDFWNEKISANVARDLKNQRLLEEDGWQHITIWECQLGKNSDTTLKKLLEWIKNGV